MTTHPIQVTPMFAARAAALAVVVLLAALVAGPARGAPVGGPGAPSGPLSVSVGERVALVLPFTHGPINVHYGTTVRYQITVANGGSDSITGVDVSHPDCQTFASSTPGFDGTSDSFAPGDTATFQCSHLVDSGTDLGDSYTNSVTVSGTDATLAIVTASDAVTAQILKPAMTILVEQRVGAHPYATSPIVADAGMNIEYRATVTNSGNTTLTGAYVATPECSGVAAGTVGFNGSGDTFQPGQTVVFTCSHIVGRGINSYANEMTVTAYDALGQGMSATDSVSATVLHPAISLVATQRRAGEPAFTAANIAVHVGEVIEYQIAVTNTGDSPVQATLYPTDCHDVQSDTQGVDGTDDEYLPGASVTFSCSHTVVNEDADPLVNRIRFVGTDLAQALVQEDAAPLADVVHPRLDVDIKQRGPSSKAFSDVRISVFDHQVIIYQVTVRNSGDVPLTGVVLSAPGCGGLASGTAGFAGSGDSYPVGKAVVFTCSHTTEPADPSGLTNTALGAGTDPLGSAVADDDTALAFIARVPPGQAAVSGVVFRDANGNGERDDSDDGIGLWTVFNDLNGNGRYDDGEPVTATQSDGNYRIGGLPPGPLNIRAETVSSLVCTLPKPCNYAISVAPGETRTGLDFGEAPPSSLVAGARTVAARATLRAPTGCVGSAFTARVRGTSIRSVTFVLDGKRLKRVTKPSQGSYAVRVNVRRLKLGVHRIVAKVVFRPSSSPKTKTLRVSFQRCGRQRVVPRFT